MKNKGFTLIEILVVVLILGILTAIALPKYQTAVDKSSFAELNLAARNVSHAQEIFHLQNGYYTTDLDDLAIKLPGGDFQHTYATIGNQEDYSYVKTSRPGLNNHCVYYFKNSQNFPGEIHCEALKDNDRAARLCTTLGGERIPGSLTDNYNTYVLNGSGNGVSSSVANAMNSLQCSEEETSGNKSCQVTKYENSSVKTVCTKKNDPNTCKHYIYDKNAYTWECDASKSKLVDGSCIPTATGTYLKRWDEDGNRIEMQCDSFDANKNACSQIAERTYNANSTKIEADRRYCAEYDANGGCLAYQQNKGYDSFGNLNNSDSASLMTSNAQAGSLDYSNSTTNWTQVNCATVDSDGSCLSYKDGWFTTSNWDENKRETYKEIKFCSAVTADRECAEVKSYTTMEGSYNANGKLNNISVQECNAKDAAGNCTSIKSLKNTEYTWNGPSNKASAEVITHCSSYDSSNNCTQYKPATSTYRTFTDDYKTQTSFTQVTCNKYTGTNCTGGWKVVYTPMVNGKDDVANRVTIDNCSNVNTTTGQCED
ncbi:MAG: prepilin-type N-terminal cleavage/methylation domain-containing protein [Elusimicrobiaceae bacterium]|nr:prepilin-type N-terminal cleavage/methylation domain-containing protein [Elusimicrobiaceae bacterium]